MELKTRIADAREMLDTITHDCPLTYSEADDIISVLDKASDEIDRLQAIVDKRPKTADNVPVEEGMKVFRMDRFDVCRRYDIGGPMIFRDMSRVLYAVSTFYSTEEAAKAASLKDGEE